MRIKDKRSLRGAFRLRVWKGGTLAGDSDGRNMIAGGARLKTARLVAGDTEDRHIAAIALGTDGTPATHGDTDITEPFIKAIGSVDYPVPGQARFKWAVAENEANGKAVKEFGLLCAGGTLFARPGKPVKQGFGLPA